MSSDSSNAHNINEIVLRTPVSGRLPQSYHVFDNDRDFAFTRTVDVRDLDAYRYAYFQRYMQRNFNGPYQAGLGTEELFALIRRAAPRGDALDVGCGTSSLFWYLPMLGVETLSCADVIPEALKVLEAFVDGDAVPQCYHDAVEIFDLPRTRVADLKARFKDFMAFDSFATWPKALRSARYDTITAFGVLAIAPGPEALARAHRHIHDHLAEGGLFLGGEWIRHPEFQTAEDGNSQAYLSREAVEAALTSAGFRISELNRVVMHNDDLHEGILMWSAYR